LLLDPYARAHVGSLTWHDACYGWTVGSPDADRSFDTRDSAPYVLKSRVVDPAFTWGHDRPPAVPWDRTIIYETHVGGYSRLHPAVPEKLRGTFGGLAHEAVIAHITGLGVTAVELLPIHTFLDDERLLKMGLRNFWGYNSIGFFSPDARYSHSKSIAEFKEMVAHLHDAGLEVLLDVVYNHTAEGNERGATLSFRGIDNLSYYRLLPDDLRLYINDTGCGNTLNLSHPRVLQMVMDSLRYWVREMHVDGFRFDLATILGREQHGFDEAGGFLDSCRQDPVLSAVKLIAEPWDLGPGGYQVGGFPPGWAEWNDRFRDIVRSFWLGGGRASDLAARLCASGDMFDRRGRKPWASVNFVTAHDGFTLTDLVSYQAKHNLANAEEGRDGTDNNHSNNYGVEGPTADPAIHDLRERQKRNLLATLLLSQGTPMLLAGDEFGRTQAGNNNAYCQDNEISWVNWHIDAEGEALHAFVQRLIALRARFPMLRRRRFLTGRLEAELGFKDVTWISPAGREMQVADWDEGHAGCFGMLMDGRAHSGGGIARAVADTTLLMLLNADAAEVAFTIPDYPGGRSWGCMIDTTLTEHPPRQSFAAGDVYPLPARSLLVLALQIKTNLRNE
jgi:glycogen operon protein